MTTLYVAGPMTGYPDFNYPEFRRVGAVLAERGYTVLNPVDAEEHNPTPGTPQPWDWYMRHALRMVLEADALALLPGWAASRGASLEVQVARALGLAAEPWDTYGLDPAPGPIRHRHPSTARVALLEGRIAGALERLTQAAEHTFRRTPTGELVESVGCHLTGRSGSWWPPSSPQPY